MGWFLLRKPYPGFSERNATEERIEILGEEVLLGRGRECTVNCLSMYVSRIHLKVMERNDDIFLKDLGSSNGTFVNQTKIQAQEEFQLNVGDEIGIGNINVDSSDCYVYIVHHTCEEKTQMLPKTVLAVEQVLPHKDLKLEEEKCTKAEKPQVENDEDDLKLKKEMEDVDRLKEDIQVDDNLQSRVCSSIPGRNLKRCAIEPEVVELSDEEDICELVSTASKRAKIDGDSKIEPELKRETLTTATDSSSSFNKGTSALAESSANELHEDFLKQSPCPAAVPLNSAKPLNRRLSTLMGESADSSAGTLKLSSPSQSSSRLSTCRTPSKLNSSEDVKPLLTSTPCNVKAEEVCANSTTAEVSGDWSPIGKQSSRNSQDSSANYTLDEEIIPIESSDDDDDVFPCSQMFSEENDIKPSVDELQKQDIIDLSLDDDEQEKEVVILSSDDDEEEEEDDEDTDRWFKKLSQCSIKMEPEEEEDIMNIRERCNKMIEEELREFSELPDEVQKTHEEKEEKCEVGRDVQETHRAKEEWQKKGYKSKEKPKAEDRKDQNIKASTSETIHKEKINEVDKGRDREVKDKDRKHKEKSLRHERDDRKRKKDTHSHRPYKHKSKEAGHDSTETREDPLKRLQKGFAESDPKEEGSVSSVQAEKLNVLIPLTRVDEDPVLNERYNLSRSNSSSPNPPSPLPPRPHPPSPTQKKKSTRKVELVDALPNPSRRAKNRGISGPSAMKMFQDSREERRRSTDDPKSSKYEADSKTIRKEKLARVAAERSSKERKEKSESKRGAPAKVKITAANRGSFLVDGDEASPTKPRSRKDVVGKMKIPKVKDKAVVNLPTKSPLQDMNMSWEKDKPKDQSLSVHRKVPASSTATCSRTSVPPVEIPTGPQPKKRIAQVPPPGFYDGPSGSAIKFQAPTKSCLGGSSKHNSNLNIPITKSAPKKRVQFKENLEEIRFIDPMPGTRRLGSSKDADRPKAMSETVKLSKPTASDEAILQDVIYDISKWNPIWLREEKNLPPEQPPPVVSNMKLPSLPKTEFLDFEEYHDTMYPLLMLDLWCSVSKEYNLHINDSRNNMVMAVDSATSSAVISRQDRMLTTLNCHMLVENSNTQNCHPKLGNLVIIDLALKDSSGKAVVIPVFGYVGFDTKNRLSQHDKVHKDLVAYCRNPAFKVRFSLFIRERRNCTYVLDRPMRLKNVKYVRGDLRVFQALKSLQCMPLLYSVISPSSANEDFTLPDASSKILAFPQERLNPTQERVVLQTAEVCLQDKPKICLIQGPPGTGKSQVILSLVMQLLYRDGIYSRANRERGLVPRILLCAPSNNAVDVLVRRLLVRRQLLEQQHRFKMVRVGQPQHIHPDVKGISLKELALLDIKNQTQNANDPQLIHSDIAQIDAKLKSIENTIRDLQSYNKPVSQDLMFRQADYQRKKNILEDRIKQQMMENNHKKSKVDLGMERDAMKKLLRGADIVATTLTSCLIKVMENVFSPTSDNHYHFQVCIVDEATQCVEVETLIPLILGVKTLVLVGDPNQLPATIMSKLAREKGLGTSLFSRLMKTVPKAVQALDVQYRMHPEILKWPNSFFYNRRLQTPPQIASCRESKVRPYAVLSLPFTQDPQGEVNMQEAEFILQLAATIVDKRAIPHEFRVGIVTPYQSQRRTIQELHNRTKRLSNLEINTIDSFQGQEKDVILISCVRTSGVGFLADKQRINVALTRAKYALFICGNFSSLDRDSMWNHLLLDSRQRKCFLELNPRFNFHSKEDIWNVISKK